MNLIHRLRSSLRYKMAGVMLLLSLGALASVTLVTLQTLLGQISDFSGRINQASEALRSDVVGLNLSSAAADTVNDIDTFMLERIEDVRRMSEEPYIIEAARLGTDAAFAAGLDAAPGDESAVRQVLGDKLFIEIENAAFSRGLSYLFSQTERPETPFVEITLTELNGINVLITRPVAQRTLARESWWQAALDPSLAGIGVSSPKVDEATGLLVIGIALPVVDSETKEINGVVYALVNLTGLQQRLSQKALRLDVQIQAFSSDGLLLAESASGHAPSRLLNPAVQATQDFAPAAQALQAAPGPDGAGFGLVQTAEDSLVVGYAHTSDSGFYDVPAQLTDFPGFGWGVTVSQPEARALQVLAPLIETASAFSNLPSQLGRSFLFFTVLAAIVTLSGAILFSGSITRPLIQLNQMSRRVQEGDLNVQVEITGQDEVGELGRAFNMMTEGLRQRERERDIFGRVVSPEVREKLLAGRLALGGETRWVSVLFSDIRGFSTISEQMEPQELVAFLNEYLSEMSDAIKPYGGYINNFIGDAIVAIFGAPIDQPDKELRAVAAAIQMRMRLEQLNDRRIERGEDPIQFGIGISTGEAVAGQIGSLERLLYTVIGDAVNVAARLETLTKDYPDYHILINGQTAEGLKSHKEIVMKHLGPIQVKGRSEPVEVYAVTQWEGDGFTGMEIELKELV